MKNEKMDTTIDIVVDDSSSSSTQRMQRTPNTCGRTVQHRNPRGRSKLQQSPNEVLQRQRNGTRRKEHDEVEQFAAMQHYLQLLNSGQLRFQYNEWGQWATYCGGGNRGC